MEVGIEPHEIAEALYGNHSARHCTFVMRGFLKKYLERFPTAATEIGKQAAIIKEISSENLWDAEGEVAVGHSLEDLLT